MSQQQFASKFNVDQTAVSNWETGKNGIDIEIAMKISEEIKMPVEFVLGKDFKMAIPLSEWHKSAIEDMNKESQDARDYFLFLYWKGYFQETSGMTANNNTINGNNNIIGNGNMVGQSLTSQEKALIDLFRIMDEIQKAELLSYAAKLKK